MNGLNLIAWIAGQRVALPAATVESVVEVDAITPVPLSPRHVAGLAALRSRVLTVIDSYAALDLPAAVLPALPQAVVVTVDGHSYGLLVDEVEDVVTLLSEPQPLPAGLARGWRAAATAVVEHGGHPMLLLDPARLVAGPAELAA